MVRTTLLALSAVGVALGGTTAAADRVVAFMSTRDGPDPHIYVMRADGGSVRRVTRAHGDEPTWSPDGRRIAFSRVYDTPSFVGSSIWTIGPDGRHERRLTRDREMQWEPDWSPDGRRIAFEAGVRGSAIAVVARNGGRRRLLTSAGGRDHSPAWSPDGERIVFASSRSGAPELLVIDVDTGRERRLTRNAVVDVRPDWRG